MGVVETVSLGAIMPFVAIATNPKLIETNDYYRAAFEFFGFSDAANFTIAFGFVLIGFYVLRAIAQFFNVLFIYVFSHGIGEELKCEMFERSLAASYQAHTQTNSAKIIKIINQDSERFSHILTNVIQLIGELIIFVMLYAMIVFAQWKITLVLTVILAVKVLIILKTISRRIGKIGRSNSTLYETQQRSLQSSLANFKIIKLLGNAHELLDDYKTRSLDLAKNNAKQNALANTPRIFMETLGFSILVALVIYVIWKYRDASAIVPIVSMFVLVLYRLLPSAQRILFAFNTIRLNEAGMENIYKALTNEIPHEGDRQIGFERSIALKDISFSFNPKKPLIADINLTIKKGEKIGFCGESGGGKSTLVDLISGIYSPDSGLIAADDEEITLENVRAWREKIGLIPQDIYLFDGTIAENVSFGKKFDEQRVINALKRANIYDFLQAHEGIRTRVGEDGVLLSGGQKQRVGIARAIYGDPDLLILDEATSALDSKTEAAIMNEIYDVSNNRTLLIVAHRLSTLSRCDRVYRIEKGRLVETEVPH
ncbi:multidrug transporter [Campylobacterota bacterium]|nr:multidrug transporter [Campylobacterota bacterium]